MSRHVAYVMFSMLTSAPTAAQPVATGQATTLPAGRPTSTDNGLTLTAGIAPVMGMAWQGSRDVALSIFPDIRLNKGEAIFVSVREGLGWNAINADGWKAGPLVKLRFGRDEKDGGSPFQIAGGSDALRGMGDIGLAGEAGAFVEKRLGTRQQWRARAEVRQGFGGHDGVVGDLSISYASRAGKVLYTVGPRVTLATRDYVQTYFGVDGAQAQRTGLALARPDGGLVSYGMGATATRLLNRASAITAFAGIDRLGGEPGSTSLIRERGRRTQFTLGLGYAVRFRL